MRSIMYVSDLKKQLGVSLIELLVSLVIAAMIFAGVVQLFATSSTNALAFEGASRIQENARYAFNRIESDLVQAGSLGCFNVKSAQELGRVQVLLGDDTAQYERFDMANFVSGVEGTGTFGSDELVVRYASRGDRIPIRSLDQYDTDMAVDNTDPDYANLRQYQVVWATNCTHAAVFMITNDPSTSAGAIQFVPSVVSPAGSLNEGQFNTAGEEITMQVVSDDPDDLSPGENLAFLYGGSGVVEYKIDDSAAGTCNAANPQNCALFRNDLEIVEGVEAFDIEYGWEDAGGNLRFGNWTAVAAADGAIEVDRLRITATFNSVDRTATVSGDEYLSKEFSRTFMLRNQLPVY